MRGMTLTELERRDQRIAELEALPATQRSADEHTELELLVYRRDLHWRRIGAMHAMAICRARDLEIYAARHRLTLDGK